MKVILMESYPPFGSSNFYAYSFLCKGNWADITWTGSWVSFLDAMLQTSLLCTTSRNLAVPIDFERIIIDPVVFRKHLKQPEEGRARKYISVPYSTCSRQV